MDQDLQTSDAAAPPRAGGESPLRFCWAVAATGLAVLYTAVLASLAALSAAFGRPQGVGRFGRMWGRIIIRTAGVKVEFEGLENIDHLGSFILVANHQSMFDILALLAYFPRPVRFVAKKELLKIPIFGFALKNGGHIVVDRERGGQAVRKAIEIAKSGICIVFFAEGHRFSDNQVHRFNPGAAWLALQTKLPCVPTAIRGSGAIMPRGAKLVVPGGTMRMKMGPPILTDSLQASDRNKLTRQLEQSVRDLFSAA
ncbi:MAG TPA: lysophospholipid acyltransferase family protein [Candidatus Binataceae bacterium]|jgi:1-acyl-sn-glycerol-3-phosphate acyltransferase|nr:lysophospholipid acyltransferase family protein [Candidatus Binataceae bacterium]